ncbi:hypothetical protein BC351_39060 [Paenibacillus ferrarius]|uniref:Butirosin biosynthesis protein H N-terminal domain-containing protein n=1 Tax=Paenibacillus ferrarius TaxID=1469647 RepID=A0A1V4H9E7_9BACL|nr:BtrH N-terminal domain-containing protein [Paenibacillus ferrarius]OPH47990.1 hypothetical protein BC351_39060 [Paenibacillus ferrarius]
MSLVMQMLKKYEDKYLHCQTAKIVSYLMKHNVRCELLFYCALESTNELYQKVVLDGVKIWNYPSRCLNKADLSVLGVEAERKILEGSAYLNEEIHDVLASGRSVLLNCDTFFLPHRKGEYQKKHEDHWIFVDHYDDIQDQYVILDDKSNHVGDFLAYTYCGDLVREAFDHSRRIIKYYQFAAAEDNFKNILLQRAATYIANFEDDGLLFDHIGNLLRSLEPGKILIPESIVSCLNFLSGSRFLTAMFLDYIGEQDLALTYKQISEETLIIRQLMIKFMISGHCDLPQILWKLDQLKHKELTAIVGMKRSVVKGVSQHHS